MDIEDLVNRLYRGWAARGAGESFPWDQELPLKGAVERAVSEMNPDVGVCVDVEGEAGLLLVGEEGARIITVGSDGARIVHLGSLEGGVLTDRVERLDERNRLHSLSYTHSRIRGGSIAHEATTEAERDDQERLRARLRVWSTGNASPTVG